MSFSDPVHRVTGGYKIIAPYIILAVVFNYNVEVIVECLLDCISTQIMCDEMYVRLYICNYLRNPFELCITHFMCLK